MMNDTGMRILPFLGFFVAFSLSSCGNGLLSDMARSSEDPVVRAPAAVSFQKEGTVYVSWEADKGADSYVLERAIDVPAPVFEVVYSGKDTAYTDTNCALGSQYLYRLTKVRGSSEFGPSAAVLGVASETCRDAYEPNDTREQATSLDYAITANLYYYRSFGGKAVSDADWYYITVPPRMLAYVVITQEGLANEASSSIRFSRPGEESSLVKSGVKIELLNSSYSTLTIPFMLYPDPAAFLSGIGGGGGGTLKNYTVQLYSMEQR